MQVHSMSSNARSNKWFIFAAIFIRQVIPFHCAAKFYVCTVCSYNERYLLVDSVWGVDTILLAGYVCLNTTC